MPNAPENILEVGKRCVKGVKEINNHLHQHPKGLEKREVLHDLAHILSCGVLELEQHSEGPG